MKKKVNGKLHFLATFCFYFFPFHLHFLQYFARKYLYLRYVKNVILNKLHPYLRNRLMIVGVMPLKLTKC